MKFASFWFNKGLDPGLFYPEHHRGVNPLASPVLCGERGIRTLGTVPHSTHAFQACTLDHSVTSPERIDAIKEFQRHKIRKKYEKQPIAILFIPD